jgi:hypothetical protein
MVSLQFVKNFEFDNPSAILLKATFTGDYGVNGVGDLLNLEVESAANPYGITDPTSAYDLILASPTANVGIFSPNLGGSYVQIKPPAAGTALTLQNLGLQMFEAGGAEKATNAAYTAGELAGYVLLLVLIPKFGQ